MNKHNDTKVPWYKSFLMSIILWFLPLTLVPMLFISYDSNKETIQTLEESAFKNIVESSILEKKFIQNWFHYRVLDIQNWSKEKSSRFFLLKLEKTFLASGLRLDECMKSDIYKKIVQNLGHDLVLQKEQYDYVYDIFLIDREGNILYTVEKKSDLATNLFTGKYSRTKFASSFKKTIEDGKIHFSDLEHYTPSSNEITGFLTAPIYDKNKIVGVFAAQIKLDTIYNMFNETSKNRLIKHYLVGSDGLLRSKMDFSHEILNLKVQTEQFYLWQDEHVREQFTKTLGHETILTYEDPYGYEVFGVHQNIDILDVKWALISESKTEFINEVTQNITHKAELYFLIIMFIVIIVAFFISRQIVKPIRILSEAVSKFAQGDNNIHINVKDENEIGLLSDNFNEMIESLNEKERLLIKQTKEAHKALHELDEQKLALNSHAIVAITNVKGDITFVNDKFVEISGYTREELMGANHRLLNSGEKDKNYWSSMYHQVSRGEIWHDEVRNMTKEGRYYWVDTTIVPFFDEKHKLKSYIAIRTDITDQKILQKNLIESKELAEESVKTKAEFLASMSHEIRTPMNGVIGMLGLLMNTHLNESQRHQAYLAQSSATALLALINDILDFSKVEAGKLELDMMDFNIHKELGDFAEAIAFRAQEKGIEVVLDISHIDIDIIHADANRIRQILNNIVGNSIKFTSHGYVLITAELHQEDEGSARLHVSIEDTGIGIPEDKIATLFDSFSQVDTSTTRKYGGTGLGLAIVKKLCELMDGEVKVSSKLGEGSTFDIDIHVDVSEQASSIKASLSLMGKSVLIVDASKISRITLRAQLESWGMKVFCVSSSDEALALVDERFDIAFIDKDIESLSAEDLGACLKKSENFLGMKLVIMTSVSDRRDINVYIAHGYDAHFPKPATTSDIFNALNVLMDESVSLQNKEAQQLSEEDESVYIWSEDVRILLVDDNKVNQLVANGLLEEFNLEADVVNDGAEALEALKNAGEKPYTLVLMDCQMPVMDGYEASTRIKAGEAGELNVTVPIVAMTANAMEGDKEKCFAAGMDDYIAKPIDVDILEAKLKKYLIKDV